MYTSFFNLSAAPFENDADPAFLWLGENHKEALAALRYGILDNKGFLLLTGASGTGKTMLLNVLTRTLEDSVICTVISDPGLERIDFYNAIAAGFGLEKSFSSKVQFLIQFSHFLHNADNDGKTVVLLVDDCHLLSQEMLEELRLLSNIEKMDKKLINIFFIGQRSFNDMLLQPKNRAVRQRLTLKAELAPLSQSETEEYIRHRLKMAGCEEPLFSVKAVQMIQDNSQGVPKQINQICDQLLTAAAEQEVRNLDHDFVAGCLRGDEVRQPEVVETESVSDVYSDMSDRGELLEQDDTTGEFGPQLERGFNLGEERRRPWAKYVGSLVLLLAVGGGIWYSGLLKQESDAPESVNAAKEEPVATKLPGLEAMTSPPAITVLGKDAETISDQKAEALKSAILQKAYESVDKDDASSEAPEPVEATADAAGAKENAENTGLVQEESEPVVTQEVTTEQGSVRDSSGQSELPALPRQPGQPSQPGQPAAVDIPATTAPELAMPATPQVDAVIETAMEQKQPEAPPVAEVAVPEPPVALAPPIPEVQQVQVEKKKKTIQPPLSPRKVVLPLQANSTRLTARAKRDLDDFLEKLEAYPKATLLLKGFVSAKTNSPENIKLSEDRAKAVRQVLLESGFPAARIAVKGMGNQEPIASNNTYEGRRQNRRVELVVLEDGI